MQKHTPPDLHLQGQHWHEQFNQSSHPTDNHCATYFPYTPNRRTAVKQMKEQYNILTHFKPVYYQSLNVIQCAAIYKTDVTLSSVRSKHQYMKKYMSNL